MPKKIAKKTTAVGSKKTGNKKLLSTGASTVDYLELQIYVENGCVDVKNQKGQVVKALTPRQVQLKFPQFLKYNNSSFSSVLYRMKKQALTSVKDQEVYGENNGLQQSNNISKLHSIFKGMDDI